MGQLIGLSDMTRLGVVKGGRKLSLEYSEIRSIPGITYSSCAREAIRHMAQPQFPGAPDTAAYADGDQQAIYRQLKQAYDSSPQRVREFAFTAANAIGQLYCPHVEAPEPLPVGLNRDARKAAAAAHPGLCGYFQAGVIAGVEFEDVATRAAGKGAPATMNVFRNQVS